jgi:RNA polymerase sigma-70 factor (TIGR02943 family)
LLSCRQAAIAPTESRYGSSGFSRRTVMEESRGENKKQANPAEWVDRHGDYLYRYALSRLRDSDASEEVVQETFVAGLRSVDQYSGSGAERAWLLGILKRKIVDHVRQRSRAGSVDTGEDSHDPSDALFDQKGAWKVDPRIFGSEPSALLERREFWQVFRRCLDGLPARQADAFTLRELDGKSSQQVCKDLEITPSNLWVLLYRARLSLANCMKARWPTEGGP